jgi:nucleotide-binding universal stress UspA family protein
MYQRILVPVDGSETSNRGLEEAMRLAKEHQARLRLFHVMDLSVIPGDSGAGFYLETLRHALRQKGDMLLKEATAAAGAQGLNVESRLHESFAGRPAEAIVREAESWAADLIVMGTHGRRGIDHFFLGSDAETVVRMSPVPVLLVRAVRTASGEKQAVAA